MKKIFIILVFIMLACTGCGIGSGQRSVDITSLPGISVTPEPLEIATVTPEPAESASAAPEPAASATVKPKPTATNDYKINSDSIILSGLRISDLESYFDFNRGELIQKLGNEYEPVDSGAEGTYRGHHYRGLGITLVFDDNYDSFEKAPLLWIDCDVDKLELNGLSPDMSLNQIQERIGKGEIIREKIDEDIWYHKYWYTLTYKIGSISLEFRSFTEDASDGYGYWVRIKHK